MVLVFIRRNFDSAAVDGKLRLFDPVRHPPDDGSEIRFDFALGVACEKHCGGQRCQLSLITNLPTINVIEAQIDIGQIAAPVRHVDGGDDRTVADDLHAHTVAVFQSETPDWV
jgi:hypothetical protein